MTKEIILKYLPEFGGVKQEALEPFLTLIHPKGEYKNEEMALVFFIAYNYYEYLNRKKYLQGLGDRKAYSIADVSITLKDDILAINPYKKMFEEQIVIIENYDLAIGFMVCK